MGVQLQNVGLRLSEETLHCVDEVRRRFGDLRLNRQDALRWLVILGLRTAGILPADHTQMQELQQQLKLPALTTLTREIVPCKPLLRGGDAPTPRAGRLILLGDRPFRSYRGVA